MLTPPAARRASTADDFAALVVLAADALVFLAPELAFPPDVAAADPLAGAGAVEPLALPVCEAGAGVFEADAFAGVLAFTFPVVAAAEDSGTDQH